MTNMVQKLELDGRLPAVNNDLQDELLPELPGLSGLTKLLIDLNENDEFLMLNSSESVMFKYPHLVKDVPYISS